MIRSDASRQVSLLRYIATRANHNWCRCPVHYQPCSCALDVARLLDAIGAITDDL